MKKYATKRLINSVWTLTYREVGDKIEILGYSRNNDIGYDQEKDLPRCSIVEDEARTVLGVKLLPYKAFEYNAAKSDKVFEVINPEHVFSYK